MKFSNFKMVPSFLGGLGVKNSVCKSSVKNFEVWPPLKPENWKKNFKNRQKWPFSDGLRGGQIKTFLQYSFFSASHQTGTSPRKSNHFLLVLHFPRNFWSKLLKTPFFFGLTRFIITKLLYVPVGETVYHWIPGQILSCLDVRISKIGQQTKKLWKFSHLLNYLRFLMTKSLVLK